MSWPSSHDLFLYAAGLMDEGAAEQIEQYLRDNPAAREELLRTKQLDA